MNALRVLPLLVFVFLPALPAQRLVQTFASPGAGQSFGRAVTVIGDVDSDGVADVAIGAYNANHPTLPTGGQAGAVWVFSGATGTSIRAHYGTYNLMQLGRAVAAAGDVDLDGVPDLLAGAPMLAPPLPPGFPVPPPSGAHLYSGATGALIRILASTGNDESGAAVASAGSIDGDPIPDQLVGAPAANLVHVFAGSNGALVYTLTAPSPGSFGRAVASTGDIDGDGARDVLVGAPNAVVSGVTAGAAYLYSGASGALLRPYTFGYAAEAFGAAMIDLGDVNGDGVADHAVSAPNYGTPAAMNVGRVYMLSGSSGSVLWTMAGTNASDFFGFALADAGDLDGDGARDLAIGIPNGDAGSTDAGRVEVRSGRSGALLAGFDGLASLDRLGSALSSGGDADGDGAIDILAGSGQSSGSLGGALGYGALVSFGPFLGPCATANLSPTPAGIPDVLLVNGSAGGTPRRVNVGVNQPLTVEMLSPPGNPTAPFLLFGLVGFPPSTQSVALPLGIGAFCFPPSLLAPPDPALFLLATSYAGFAPFSFLVTPPAPWSLPLPGGLAAPVWITLQGAIEATPGVLRSTNAVLVEVQ